jgi:ADP-dependent NAD(P)H-hydrate dehydratase / NAD(P)H-hydrate epimerase
MRLPAPLSRANPRVSKKDFGSALIIAGSPAMLGAAALSSLACLRSGAGLVTAAVAQGLNLTLQEKISHEVMTLPLPQAPKGTLAARAYSGLERMWARFNAVAIGPGMGRDAGTLALARRVIIQCPKPLVVDADALFALAGHVNILCQAKAPRILTPHEGEMARLVHGSGRIKTAKDFARRYKCVLLLKGHRTVVASPEGKTYINRTGNAGMATAGSGDVLTGIIAGFTAQGLGPFEAARWGAYIHGKAGDRACRTRSKAGMIATDIIECIPYALKNA